MMRQRITTNSKMLGKNLNQVVIDTDLGVEAGCGTDGTTLTLHIPIEC